MGTKVYFLKKFSNANNYNAYVQSNDFKRPNISIDNTTVHLSTPENNKIDISISDEQNLNNYTKATCSLKKFKTLSEYTNYVNSQNFKRPNISYCIETERVYWDLANGSKFDLPLEPQPPKVGDILYSDNTTHKLSFTSEVLEPSEGKTPIALCVAPRRFFGYNEKARWMSLKYMSWKNPESGGFGDEDSWLYPGNNNNDLPGIRNISQTYILGDAETDDPNAYLTADWIDNNIYYSDKIPSVFDINGNWNINELGAFGQYAMTDIGGDYHTMEMVNSGLEQTTWYRDEQIINEGGNGYAPAACCCCRYCPQGTQFADWYLPASGELAMIITQKPLLANKMTALNEKYIDDCYNFFDRFLWHPYGDDRTEYWSAHLQENGPFVSSTEGNNNIYISDNSTWHISLSGRIFSSADKGPVIALLQY